MAPWQPLLTNHVYPEHPPIVTDLVGTRIYVVNTDDPIDWFKLTAYFAGECTAEERDALEQWLQAAPERRHLLDRLRMVWAARHQRPAVEYGREGAIAHVMAMIQQWQAREIAPPQTARPAWKGTRVLAPQSLRRGVWYAVAGAALAVLTLKAGWHVGSSRRGAHTGVPVSAYVTGNGERANITLPDSNTVALNVASRLEVPADYLAGDHTLRLSGEALFTIQHHVGTPLTVVAGQTATRVLGTSFVVRHYATDSVTMVAVREGKVAVGTAVVMSNRLIEVRRKGVVEVRPATPSQFSFATGTLTLDDLYLPQAIPELDRWYDVDIRLGDPALAVRGVGGEFAIGSPDEVATYLEVALDVRVVRNGRVLTLYPRQ